MFANHVIAHHDSYLPDSSQALVNSVRSYINSKLDHETKTFDFVTEVRRRLYIIHEYNCQVAQVTHKYPRSRKFDLLLIRYVELESDVLYHNTPHPSRQREIATEIRVLRLLQVILYPAVLTNEPLISKNTDRVLKSAVLQLLGEVKSTYLVENKLICNIANKLLKKIKPTDNDLDFSRTSSIWEIHKNLATSDYGTDDNDSDFDNDIIIKNSTKKRSTDCIEVPLTTAGVTPVPTIEFTDDDNYFVYLERRASTKRKIHDSNHIRTKRSALETSNKSTNNVNRDTFNKTCNKPTVKCHNESEPLPKYKPNESSCVILSDSEDETCEVTLNHNKISKLNSKCDPNVKKTTEANKNNCGVVTFEILDDDDDGKPNYMVYLQKEIETNRKRFENKVDTKEIIICSDSDDESAERSEAKETNHILTLLEKPSIEIKSSMNDSSNSGFNQNHTDYVASTTDDDSFLESKLHTEFFIKTNDDEFDVTPSATEDSSRQCSEEMDMEEFPDGLVKLENDNQLNIPATNEPSPKVDPQSPCMDSTFLILDENLSTNFLVDPTMIFEKNEENCIKTTGSIPNRVVDLVSAIHLASEVNESSAVGDPLLSETSGPDDLEISQECRLNESFLEALLLDDSYLLNGRKEFEELESFLFNDSAEKQSFSLGSFTFDDNESVVPSETFDVDMKSLESLLDNSQLLLMADFKSSGASDDSSNNRVSLRKTMNKNSTDPLKDSTNDRILQKNTVRTPCRKEKTTIGR